MIEVTDLVKSYGSVEAVRGVTFRAQPGEVLGLLGPNGAGKSSVMRVLVGLSMPTSGIARIHGADVSAPDVTLRRRVGYLPENAALYPQMRVIEYLGYRAAVRGLASAAARGSIERAMGRCDLRPVAQRIIGQLSKGYRQRVALAATLLHEPDVLILDEPTVGLDPLQMREVRHLVRQLAAERTVLLSTHILAEAEVACDRVVILDRGQVLAEGPPAQLAVRVGARPLRLEVLGSEDAVRGALGRLAGVQLEVLSSGAVLTLRVQGPGIATRSRRADLSRALCAAGCTVTELSAERVSLEEVFARLTGEREAS